LGIGDWGLGIGPIPNPQSPLDKFVKQDKEIINLIIITY
jgi:hypothetical protein